MKTTRILAISLTLSLGLAPLSTGCPSAGDGEANNDVRDVTATDTMDAHASVDASDATVEPDDGTGVADDGFADDGFADDGFANEGLTDDGSASNDADTEVTTFDTGDGDGDGDTPVDTTPETVDPCEQPELCNGIDDDCDGLIDEGLAGLPSRAPRVILFIADGTGFAQINAARMYANGDTAPLSFEAFPHVGQVSTYNALGGTTDSAAAATAMATGRKVTNSVISKSLPGDGANLPTVLEAHKRIGRRTGLITTYTPATDATPAAFGAHATTRYDKVAIAASYLNDSRPNVLIGLADAALTPESAQAAGYTVATTVAEFDAADAPDSPGAGGPHLAGLFPDKANTPPLADLVTKALDLLDAEPAGFFLLVEHEGTDEGGHGNDTTLVLDSLLEIEAAVTAARQWAEGRDDVLLVFTADHETGGLLVTETNPTAGVVPEMQWNTGSHTPTPVPIYAWGAGAEALPANMDNTEIHQLIAPVERARLSQGVNGYWGVSDTTLRQGFPTGDLGGSPTVVVDGDDPIGSGLDVQSLVRFDELAATFGANLGAGFHITQAHLALYAHDAGDPIAIHHMLSDWVSNDSWNSLVDGVDTDGVEASSATVGRSAGVGIGEFWIPITDSMQRWMAGDETNAGLLLNPTGNSGVTMPSSEAGGKDGPSLVVDFTCGVRTQSFQNGVASYVGGQWVQLSAGAAEPTPLGSNVVAATDTETFLVRFDDVFGSTPGQVPEDVQIISATVTWTMLGQAVQIDLHRMLTPWTETTVWGDFGEDGVQPDNVEAGATSDATSKPTEGTGRRILDLSQISRQWQANPVSHQGWVAIATGGQATMSLSSDGSGPTLTIVYIP